MITVLSIVLYHSGKIQLQFKSSVYRKILRQSYPFAILILLMSFFNRIDSVMIERLLEDGKEQAGIYAQSFRVLDALSHFAVLFAGMLLPMFSKMLKTGDRTEDLVRISSSLLLGVAIAAAVAGIFFNENIIRLMFPDLEPAEAITYSASIFSILMGGFVFISISYIYGTLLTANHNLKQLNLLAGATVIINVTLNLLLIPAYKAYGAAIASIVSQGFYAIGQVIAAHSLIKLDLRFSLYGKLLLYGILLAASAAILHRYLDWLTAFLIFIAFSGIMSMLTGIIRPKEILSIFREE